MNPRAHAGPPRASERLYGDRRRPGGARVTVAAFLISGLIHAAAVAIYPLLFGPPPLVSVVPIPRPREQIQGTRVIRIVEVSGDLRDVAAPVETIPVREPDAPDVALPEFGFDVDAPLGEAIRVYEAAALSAAERLRVLPGNPRLWPDLPPEVTEVPRDQMARILLAWALEDMADSAAAAAAAEAEAMDWTHTDDEGRRWGVSPGKLHLGGITIPMPSFSAPYGSLAARRGQEDAEINRAAGTAIVHETLKERAKAIRERRDLERARRTRSQPPDTTFSGG
ncbi:MAG TPA: hypothetical protein VGA70_01960 [Longimicrobiales bacterium]|jgi:hypothetical protein